jgi:hypothetical protein
MVRALDRDSLCRAGDGLVALAAKDIRLFLGRLFFGFLFDLLGCFLTASFPGPLAKQRRMNDLCPFHFTCPVLWVLKMVPDL